MCGRGVLFTRLLFTAILAGVQFLEASATPASCRDSWDQWKQSCYKFYPNGTTWQTASDRCAEEGATLVTILSLEENNFVNSLMQGKAEVVWIDLRREKQTPGKYVWHSGHPAGFKNWKNGEPNGTVRAGFSEDCVYMNKNGTWLSSMCINWASYICKISPPTQVGGHESKEKSYFNHIDWALVDHVFSVKEASSELECAWFCLNNAYCESFNYKLVQLQCELNAATEVQYPMDFIRQPGSIYSSPTS